MGLSGDKMQLLMKDKLIKLYNNRSVCTESASLVVLKSYPEVGSEQGRMNKTINTSRDRVKLLFFLFFLWGSIGLDLQLIKTKAVVL